jgi:NAD-dependent deacetylase
MTFPPELLACLAAARRVAVLTGAGVSAESGVPTFRDAQTGLWAKYRPEDLATPRAFRLNPRLVWEWYAWRRELVAQAKPNPAHLALAELAALVPEFSLITQNVDGLHQRAGSSDVIELHGNITRSKCFNEDKVIDTWEDTNEIPPRCPDCGGPLRPDVVWFEEALPEQALDRAICASEACEVFLSIGTSALVQPAASLPLRAARQGTLVEINPQPTPLTREATFVLTGPAGGVLPELLTAWRRSLATG